MDIQQIETDLSYKLSKKRFIHTLGVVESAIYLAKKYGANVEDARLARCYMTVLKNYHYWKCKI